MISCTSHLLFVFLSMQGRQEIQAKLYYQVTLEDLVPADNFYRKLAQSLDMGYLYKATAKYYGREGQESIVDIPAQSGPHIPGESRPVIPGESGPLFGLI
jgi:hypothetical protein